MEPIQIDWDTEPIHIYHNSGEGIQTRIVIPETGWYSINGGEPVKLNAGDALYDQG